MILPETRNERDFAYAVAAMRLRARAQDAAGDTEGAIVLSQAVRDLAARGMILHGERARGLLEFSEVVADTEDKPAAFEDFMAKQDELLAAARDAKREKVVVEPEPEPVEAPKPVRRRRVKKES